MHHLSVKSTLVDTNPKGNKNVGLKGKESPVCPKPRRLRSGLPAVQFLNHPSLCTNHRQINCDARSGILEVIGEKRMEECGCKKCPLCGSPPGRTDNPLIHDLIFLQFHPTFPPFTPT